MLNSFFVIFETVVAVVNVGWFWIHPVDINRLRKSSCYWRVFILVSFWSTHQNQGKGLVIDAYSVWLHSAFWSTHQYQESPPVLFPFLSILVSFSSDDWEIEHGLVFDAYSVWFHFGRLTSSTFQRKRSCYWRLFNLVPFWSTHQNQETP